jgi:hypothetical protein
MLRVWVVVLACSAAARADEMAVKSARALAPEKCLELAPAELATRCPTIAGRFGEIDQKPIAFLDEWEARKGTFVCEKDAAWRCRRVVVLDRDLRGARQRSPASYVTASELLKRFASAGSVRVRDDFGLSAAPRVPPRTCAEVPGRGCATQAARLRVTDRSGAPLVRRRVWLVEDQDGPMLACSDAALTRCDELDAAGWVTLALAMRPSALTTAQPAPELDLPDMRADRRPDPTATATTREPGESGAGALDAFLRNKHDRALPSSPSRKDALKLTRALSAKGAACLQSADRATVELLLSGAGQLIALTVDGADNALLDCLTRVARKVALPRFAADTYHLRAVVMRTAR